MSHSELLLAWLTRAVKKQGSDTLQRHFSRQKIIGQIQSIKNWSAPAPPPPPHACFVCGLNMGGVGPCVFYIFFQQQTSSSASLFFGPDAEDGKVSDMDKPNWLEWASVDELRT